MKYSRGKIIALTVLSMAIAFALFCTGFIIDFSNMLRAVNTDLFVQDPNYIPTFDDLYERIPFDSTDTGSVILGQNTKLTLTEERYDREVLTNFLNANPRLSYTDLQKKRKENYPYPIFTNTEMRSIANGLGDNLNIPVVMLDPSQYDDIVLFELTNLADVPNNLIVTRDGVLLNDIKADSICSVDSKYAADYVYTGIPDHTLTPKSEIIYDENNDITLHVFFTPTSQAVDGYTVTVQFNDGDDNLQYFCNMNREDITSIPNNTTIDLCSRDESARLMYRVKRVNREIEIFDANNVSLQKVKYEQDENELVTYEIGGVAYNGNALRGMFQEQGFYQISFKQNVYTGDGVATQLDISFAFIIVNKLYYTHEKNFPRFDVANRIPGNSEIYNYSYESEYPTVNYSSYYFDVQIQTTAEYYQNDPNLGNRELRFYNIGEYRMVSQLQFYSQYLSRHEQEFRQRGVSNGFVKLNRYSSYSSVLNIFGFQAYYGGQHVNSQFNGPLPFYDSEDTSISSDISRWVREQKMTAAESGSVMDYTNMRVSDALTYSTQLAKYVTNSGKIPVRTNFPPVKMKGNVAHATGTGMNGETKAVLSTVAFKPAYGTGNTSEWVSKQMEVGAPFEEAGQYLVTIYFKVNDEICQQTFFFEIVNSAKIAFDVTFQNGETKTFYAGDLELNSKKMISGNQVKLNYDGSAELGQFEVPPTITLAYAPFGVYNYTEVYVPTRPNGAFEFTLQPGQYRLSIMYGAHNKSTTVFSIIVDDTLATGIKANTSAKSLTNLPENVAIVGAGEVKLTWDQKPSGINYTNVFCEFYEMQIKNVDPNADRNYFNPTDKNLALINNLYAAYEFAKTPSETNNGYGPVKTENGWTLKETFQEAGLYRFTLVDDVGNETVFLLLIDNSSPTFVQSGTKSSIVTNAVNFKDEEGIYLGFGTRKLLASQGSEQQTAEMLEGFVDSLSTADLLVTELRGGKDKTQTSISIGLSKIEYSRSGAIYQELSQNEIDNGYIILKEEDTYYFRVTDMLGNVGEYYIILTHDNCKGMIYAETSAPTIAAGGRGIITEELDSYASFVTNTGGMTNRPYVTFSFEQKSSTQTLSVKAVYLTYFPLTYQLESSLNPGTANPNYPFSDEKLNNPRNENGTPYFATRQDHDGTIYVYNDEDANSSVRLALFNENLKTPAGMYIITREYDRVSDEGNDSVFRDYYFIVDNQKTLYYEKGKYQTTLKIRFADNPTLHYPQAKDADAAVFAKYNNQLSSNRIAWITGFNSKYSWKHDSIVYNIKDCNKIAAADDTLVSIYNYTFPSLIPQFSYVNGKQTTYLGEGANTWSLGDAASRTADSTYQLIVSDNARNISCIQNNGNLTEQLDTNQPTSANYDYLTLNLETNYGTKAEFVINNNKIIDNERMNFDGENYIYVVDPSEIKQLKFNFNSDPVDGERKDESMYAKVDLVSSTNSWTSTGFMHNISFAVPTPVDGQCTFDLMESFLKNEAINNGASLSVSLLTYDQTQTNYTIIFDTREPNYNLKRVKDGDNFARTLSDEALSGGYVYGLSEDFVFECDQTNNPYLDTRIITYRETDYTFVEGTQPAVQFKLYTGAEGEERIPFATIVGLRDNEMKYYYITETDYAGHSTSYKVQIQGSKYVNGINFIGAITDANDDVQIGIEMHASSSSVSQFFMRNNSFKFESGDDYYMVLDATASWHIGDDIGTGTKSEERLINALNKWINIATEDGTKCSYTLYDRIGEAEVFEFYNLRENTPKIQLDCYQVSPTNPVIMGEVTNYDDLPKILFNPQLASYYKMNVKDTVTGISTDTYFQLQGTSIQGFDVTHELIITVTDPFGRVSITEYHQQTQNTINFTVYGNTMTQDEKLYIGDERGVEFSYLRTVYNVLIYDAGTNELLTDLQSFISNNMIYYTFKPVNASTTIQQYRIVATGRASGAILFDKTFVFDTRLPNVEWKYASDETIKNIENETFVNTVVFDIRDSIVKTSFPVTISYTRTLDRRVERVTLKPGTKYWIFDQEGKYEVTLRNTVWAEKTFNFEIAHIDDELVRVYDDGVQLKASDSDYKYVPYVNQPDEYTYIPRYVFSMNVNQNSGIVDPVNEYQSHGLEIHTGQSNRVLAGDPRTGTDYYYYDAANNTMVWRLAFLVGIKDGIPEYVNPLYFATTGVSTGKLNDASFTLLLNGDPDGIRKGEVKVLTSRTYDLIKSSFMDEHDNQLTVKLFCDTGTLRDDFGAPCYMVVGNTILIDCYYNGQFVKTLTYQDSFVINRDDAGYYEFAIHDLVGNYLYFGNPNETDENSLSYPTQRYLLAVITKPMILMNDKLPINGMVYNDQVELKLVDYGNDFLYKAFANEDEKYEDFFTKRFCIAKIIVTYTGSNGQTVEEKLVNGTETKFYWNNTGHYRVRITYKISDNILEDLESEYQFQIISAYTVRKSFTMPIYADIQVVSVARNGYKINDFADLTVGDTMYFDSNKNPGSYVITLRTYSVAMQDYVTHEIRFNIQDKSNVASTYFVLTCSSGSTTVGSVSLWYNPFWLFNSQGELTIVLEKDYVEQQVVVVNKNTLESIGNKSVELFNVSDAGKYTVTVYNAENDVIHYDSWQIQAQQSTFGYIILAIVMGLLGIGILVFIRMRNKMTTK